jgi:hypothetical protein
VGCGARVYYRCCCDNFEAFTAVKIQVMVFWVVTPCSVVVGYQRFGRAYLRGQFEKFMDSLYNSESELCGGAVTVSFSKHLPWQAMLVLQRSTHFSKMCCRPLITSKFLASELPFHGSKSPEIAWGEIWTVWRMF